MFDLLMKRYAPLAFLLSTFPDEEEAPVHDRPFDVDLEKINTLYFYGLGQGGWFPQFKEWLAASPSHILILLEDSPSAIRAFLQAPGAEEILDHPQTLLHFISDKKEWRAHIAELTSEYPSGFVEFVAHPAYAEKGGRKCREMRLHLLRQSGAISGLLQEALFPHLLFDNLAPNFARLPETFYANKLEGKFKGVPAIICGAGPSLMSSMPILKTIENRALIFAGGSTIAALSNNGVVPHLTFAIDPTEEETIRLKNSSAHDVPLIYGNRVIPTIFQTSSGPFGYLRSNTGGRAEEWFDAQMGLTEETIGPDLGAEALSITTLALEVAYRMGCNPIIFTGTDLAYTGMMRYAGGVIEQQKIDPLKLKKDMRATERPLRKKDREGKTIYTLTKWIMEASCMGEYAKNHPDRTFINATAQGLPLPHIPYLPIEKAVEEHCLNQTDLRGKLHAEIENARFEKLPNTKELFAPLTASLRRSLAICDQALTGAPSVGKSALLESDLQSELAYVHLFQDIEHAYGRLKPRALLSSNPERAELDHERTKWNHLKSAILKFLEKSDFSL
jgi:hypothetical protein